MNRLRYQLVRGASRALTYAYSGRNHVAPLNPTALIWVDPMRISEIPVEKPSVPLPIVSTVKDGDWDLETRRIEDDVVYRSFEQVFIDGCSWEETDYHEFMQRRLDDDSLEWRQYQTMEDVRSRNEALEALYEAIDENGYRSQRELESNDNMVQFSNKDLDLLFLPPEFREVSVDIGRDGGFLWATGMHRLCIAKIVGIETIPVRIRVRHKRWQERRDTASEKALKSAPHPDLR